MTSRQIWVVYPFTARILGSGDEYFIKTNSTNALFVALRRIHKEFDFKINSIYMTDAPKKYMVEKDGICHRFVPVTKGKFADVHQFGKQWSLRLIVDLFLERPSIVFIFIGFGWFAIFLAGICRSLGIPYCPIVAGWGVPTRRSVRWYYGNAFRTIVHTEAHKKRFEAADVKVDNFFVLPMGVDTALFEAKPDSSYGTFSQAIEFIHVGRIVAGKNLLRALRALKVLKEVFGNVRLNIVGPVGDENYYKEIVAYLNENELKEYVTFHGEVTNEKLPALYGKADLMIFPTLSESFGFVIVESMSCGTPVAALHGKGGPDEIIQDGVDGILAIDYEFEDRIVSLLKKPDELRRMGKAARLKVEEKYNAKRTFGQLCELLKELDFTIQLPLKNVEESNE